MTATLRLAALSAALLMISAARAPSLVAQTSYPLICRGGPGLRLAPQAGTAGPSRLLLRFNRGRRGAVAGVEPGTCAWQDRGVGEAEPAVRCFGPVQHLSFEMAAGGREMAWLRAQASIAGVSLIFWEGGERPDGIAYQPSNPAEHEYFRAYHDAAHACLAVTHVGP